MSHPTNTSIRPPVEADLAFILASWRSAHRDSQKQTLPWTVYKQTYGTLIKMLLSRADVHVLAAYDSTLPAGQDLAGWIAWTPGARVATLHFVYVRKSHRRVGLARGLADAAQLGNRLVYTFRGTWLHRKRLGADDVLRLAAEKHGVSATFVPVSEFLR